MFDGRICCKVCTYHLLMLKKVLGKKSKEKLELSGHKWKENTEENTEKLMIHTEAWDTPNVPMAYK